MSNSQKYILVNAIKYVNWKFKFHILIEGLNVKKIVNDKNIYRVSSRGYELVLLVGYELVLHSDWCSLHIDFYRFH